MRSAPRRASRSCRSPAVSSAPIGYALRHGNRAGVEPLLHLHHHHAGLGIARHDRAVDRRGAAPARQQRRVQIEAAERKGLEDRLRQDEPIGDDDRHIRAMAARDAFGVRGPQRRGREHRHGEAARLALDRARRELQAAAPGGLGRAGIDRRDLVAAADDLDERRHREVGRAHEYDAQRHVRPSRRRASPCRGDEAFARLRCRGSPPFPGSCGRAWPCRSFMKAKPLSGPSSTTGA